MSTNIISKLKENKIFPIIRSSNPQDVVEKVNALFEFAPDVVEVNVENTSIFNVIKKVRE